MRTFCLAALLAPALGWAMGPFEKNHPLVDEGISAYERGEFDQALEKFDAASKERPHDARVQYNRGLALHKLGRNDEARSALNRALELDVQGELTSKIHYNLGTIAATENQREQAIREFRAALKKNPSDELARHNLEVLLKKLPPKNQPGQDGGAPDGGGDDGGRPDAGQDAGTPTDGGADAGRPDGGQPDGGGGDGGSPQDGGQDGGTDGGGQGDAGTGDGGTGDGGQGAQETPGDAGQSDSSQAADGGSDGGAETRDGGAAEVQRATLADGGVDLSKQEAEKLLDSLKSSEKNLQLWRFRQKSKSDEPHGKDW
jgi:hypothetical protein